MVAVHTSYDKIVCTKPKWKACEVTPDTAFARRLISQPGNRASVLPLEELYCDDEVTENYDQRDQIPMKCKQLKRREKTLYQNIEA